MNTSEGGQQPQKAGAGAFGGHNNPVPAQFQHEDDEEIRLTTAGYRRVCDGMAASIVRLEHENDELRAEVAVLREERAIQWRECAERLAGQMQRLADCDWVITLPDRMDAVRDVARNALAEFDRLKEASK